MPGTPIFEYVGPVKVQVTPRAGVLTDLGQTPADGRCALEAQLFNYKTLTDEGGEIPQEILGLGGIGALSFTLNKYDRATAKMIWDSVPRKDVEVAGSYRVGQAAIGKLWSAADVVASGYFGVTLQPMFLPVTGKIKRVMPRCYVEGNWWRLFDMGNSEIRVACVINVLPDPTTLELFNETVL